LRCLTHRQARIIRAAQIFGVAPLFFLMLMVLLCIAGSLLCQRRIRVQGVLGWAVTIGRLTLLHHLCLGRGLAGCHTTTRRSLCASALCPITRCGLAVDARRTSSFRRLLGNQ